MAHSVIYGYFSTAYASLWIKKPSTSLKLGQDFLSYLLILTDKEDNTDKYRKLAH